MRERKKQQTIIEIMNDVLSDVRDFYDSEYAYYIERDAEEIINIYEWCAQGVAWQRDRLKMISFDQAPYWMLHEITDTNASDYSVFEDLGDGITAILAVVGVHKGGCDMNFLSAILPYIAQSIEMQKQQIKQEYLSYHDDLTGLLNRNSFVDYLKETNAEQLTSIGALSVDINGLKRFNAEFGREYGDEVVIRVGEILEEYFRGAKVFRLTGDEFLVICENISYEDFAKQMNAADDKLENISLDLTTMGHAWEKVDINLSQLVNNADIRMRKAKQEYYKRENKVDHTPIIKQDLLNDIENGSFIVCLLPRMDVQGEQIMGAEALVRYRHKDIGIIDPSKYLTVLERTKLSFYLDIYVFEEVCKIIQRWEQNDMPMIPVSVNFSGNTLRQENIIEKMMAIVNRYRISSEYLEIEVSETNDNMNQEILAETTEKIRKENIRVILDHFGAKDSSFSILSIMEFDGLKLARNLITDIVGNPRSQCIAKSIIDVCRQLGANVTATNVETLDQLNVLKELGCDYAQGFFFNKPITVDTFEVRYMGK